MKIKKILKISGIVIGSVFSLFVILVILAINFPGSSGDEQGDTAAYEKQMFGKAIIPTVKDVCEAEERKVQAEDRKLERKVQADKARPLAARKEWIENFFGWDGSHNGLRRLIIKNMNDPKSFQHVETRYGDRGNHLILIMKYRGKNAFGGVVTEWVKAKVDLAGNVLEILKQERE